ncbi:MAG: polyribonucleotide nucleotidyltransferase [Rickettsiaceae bacterium]|nr:polyribonucleotide nucleotidyltransferase [Rickettsiaceae bacterium]
MFKEIIKEINWGSNALTLKTGKIARQADGAVVVSMGDTVILCTAVSAPEAKGDAAFFPLTVHYREMLSAAGKFPGGYKKREGQATEREVLVSRLIDRPIRPLFDPAFFNETQVICTVLSYDPKFCSDILALIGASAALAISGAPYLHIVGAAKVGMVDGQYVLNPSNEELEKSKLDLVVAGTKSSVMMVESEASELSEEQMLGAIEFGHNHMQPVISMIEELKNEVNKAPKTIAPVGIEDLKDQIIKEFGELITKAYQVKDKIARYAELHKISQEISAKFAEEYNSAKIYLALDEAKAVIVRSSMLASSVRIDGRKLDEIRNIECETGLLPRTHGSSLFTRGETQALVSVTLGTTQDEQIVESLDKEARDRFLLHYIFPPYSVGEASPFRAPGRREIGHGKLAWRAINPVLPTKDVFPYAMRIISEITESNGSSSMATVCGASMALMNAGVPLKSQVAGIAMGLIKEGDKYIVLSDIMGDEDHLGDMDFKVAGTHNGITSLQMDIKINGINLEIMKVALQQAHEGRAHIISKMELAIKSHDEMSAHAPQIHTLHIAKDKIREIIGPGGRVIKDICEISGAKVDIDDSGVVNISAVGKDKIDIAISKINEIIYEPKVGDVLTGKVVKLLDSGAFVSIPGGKDGYLHISEISHERIKSVSDALSEGMKVEVKIIESDRGKIKLSLKAMTSSSDHFNNSEGSHPKASRSNKNFEEDNAYNGENFAENRKEKSDSNNFNGKKDYSSKYSKTSRPRSSDKSSSFGQDNNRRSDGAGSKRSHSNGDRDSSRGPRDRNSRDRGDSRDRGRDRDSRDRDTRERKFFS